MAYVLVGSFSALTGTEYGQALILKVALVGVLSALAAANKLRFVPRLLLGDRRAAAHLASVIVIEWVVIIVVLLVTAVLTTNLTLPRKGMEFHEKRATCEGSPLR